MVNPLNPPFILKSRLRKPPLPVDLVVRHALLDQLDQIQHFPFTLVCAPAGYGKTTLLSSWLEQASQPYVWLNLREELSDDYWFLSYLVAALQDVYPIHVQELASLLSGSQTPSIETCAVVFCDMLYELESGLILVLNDYHLIINEKINHFIRSVVENAPEAFHLVMATRWNPALPLIQWRAQAQMIELRADQIRFQLQETCEFLQNALTGDMISETTIEALDRRTEGWITSLRLIVLSLQSAQNRQAVLDDLQQGTDRRVSAGRQFCHRADHRPPAGELGIRAQASAAPV